MNKIEGTVHFPGTVSIGSYFYPPAGSINNDAISSSATQRIAASKVVHQFTLTRQPFGPATTISAITELLHSVRGAAGTAIGLEVSVVTPATGADRTVSIDLQKSTGGGAFATILTTPLVLNNATAALTPQSAVIASSSLSDGDILRVVITVAGAAGNQAIGLLLALVLQEDPS